jgi:hypothetical protein
MGSDRRFKDVQIVSFRLLEQRLNRLEIDSFRSSRLDIRTPTHSLDKRSFDPKHNINKKKIIRS